MSAAASTDTLRYHLSTAPVMRKYSMASVPCSQVSAAINSYFGTDAFVAGDIKKPEVEAAHFYLMNHTVARVRQTVGLDEPLGELEPLVTEYRETAADMALRCAAYLVLITTREARHKHKHVSTLFAAVHCPQALSFIDSLGGGSTGAAMKFRTAPPTSTIGDYVSAVRDTFYKAGFSSAFGGKKWGNIADCLLNYVRGVYSAEMMLDLAWALAHNGGPMFNKGMLYDHYSSSDLYRVLDTQRAGQIPRLFHDDKAPKSAASTAYYERAADLLGGEYLEPVDWQAVNDAGSVKKYDVGGSSSGGKIAVKKKKSSAKAVDKSTTFVIGPKLATVKKVKIERKK